MIPNLIGVIALSSLVIRITKNYINRKVLGKKEELTLSYNQEIQNTTSSESKEDECIAETV